MPGISQDGQDGQERLLNNTTDNGVERMQMQRQQAAETTASVNLSDSDHRRHCHRLYISHALSTWNSRLFEFGAFLFLAEIYPDTLLPASVYALARAASGALLSSQLGSYIDRTDRLKVVRLSICTNSFWSCPLDTANGLKWDNVYL
jgi:hypothetical protein